MGDIQTRPFSKNYSGLINQSVIALGITVLCITGQEFMKRKRRGKHPTTHVLGSRESWEFGYLYQGRSWARFPSPPSPAGWPLSWVKQVIKFPEDKMHSLRGVDATLYVRFLRGCFWFALLHTLTTFPILFPIHVEFSDPTVPSKSMTRTSISSLVGTAKGLSLLWIHLCLLIWITFSWMGILIWICSGAFHLRTASIEAAAAKKRAMLENFDDADSSYYQHPHPQYAFQDIPSKNYDHPNPGLRLRTVMVSNVPQSLRDEKELKEYFEYWLSRKVEKPSMGITSSTQPGFLNKSFAFLFNRAKRIPARLPNTLLPSSAKVGEGHGGKESKPVSEVPAIERVVIARKMTELASLLERREEILRLLETSHIKLANKTLTAVKTAMDRKDAQKPPQYNPSRAAEIASKRKSHVPDAEHGEQQHGTLSEEDRMSQLIDVLGPFVCEFNLQRSFTKRTKKVFSNPSKQAFRKIRQEGSSDSDCPSTPNPNQQGYPPSTTKGKSSGERTIWDALLSLPRSSLDAYQPLVSLSHLFRGKTVPSIDYYTAKLNLLTSLITENRSKSITGFDAVSTAFVTFADPADARRACKYLAVHPNNPLACLVTMAPEYQDLDWIRVMKSSFKAEFLKDWVVNVGVWGFTLFWLFPVSLLVGLVSIQNISLFWPSLKRYLDRHPWQSEVIQSFLPTLLVALLALLIPLILLLIAKKAHTITTLSALHDLIMTRYYKFLIVNVLVFFCVGTAAMQSFLQSFKSSAGRPGLIQTVADSFPTAGPFYVGWLIFTTAMHGGFELALLGLPLILYPTTSRQITPRKRAVGIRPRTLNYYYWLPNHLLVIHVLLLFSVLNPFVLPFGTMYFFIQNGVIKNQLIHVYAKHYEGNGKTLLIRIVRYSLDGLVFAQVVFLTYMVVLKKTVNVGLSAILIVFTVVFKILITRMCRAQFEADDISESEGLHSMNTVDAQSEINREDTENTIHHEGRSLIQLRPARPPVLTWKLPEWINFSYNTLHRRQRHLQRPPNPFGPHPHRSSSLFSGNQPKSTDLSRSTKELPEDDYPWNNPLSQPRHDTGIRSIAIRVDDISGPVVKHPPPLSWDDQEIIDLPYDNPYYTRRIDNVLWLPRDPTGCLNLDDTVDLKVSLTVELIAGQLGTWLGLLESSSPEEISQVSSHQNLSPPILATATPPHSFTSLPEVDGTEEIDLPMVIARRVQAKEAGVEQTMRPRKSTISRQMLTSGERANLTLLSNHSWQRPSNIELPSSSSYRSTSEGTRVLNRARSSSIMSILQLPPAANPSKSSHQEFGVRPDVHAQAEFISGVTSNSKASLAPKLARSQNVSTQQAIFHEVLAEEEQALIDRLEDEQAEATKSQSTKSWLTSWLFRKSE